MVVITNHVTMLTRSLYMCVLPPICVCFLRNRHNASLIGMEIRTGFWFTSRRRGTRKNTSQEHISNAKSAVSTNQTINQSFNQSSGKNVFKWFQFLFSFCHSIVPLGTASCRWYWWRRRIFIEESTEVGLSLNPKLNIIFSIQFSSRILFK